MLFCQQPFLHFDSLTALLTRRNWKRLSFLVSHTNWHFHPAIVKVETLLHDRDVTRCVLRAEDKGQPDHKKPATISASVVAEPSSL